MRRVDAQLARETLGIIGLGTMGTAVAQGLLACRFPRARLCGAEIRAAQRRRVARVLRVRVVADIRAVVARSSILVLAVKPQELTPVLQAMRATRRAPLVISIAAGITTQFLERRLGRVPVVRAMPNTAARVGQAITALARGRWATPRHLALAQAVLRGIGETVTVPERFMNAVTAVSGSGPAYYFWLTEHLARAGMAAGLPRHTAERLARQTAVGSAGLLARSPDAPARLMAQVASKRGTTEAALKVFARHRMSAIVREAVRAATRRAAQLSQDTSA